MEVKERQPHSAYKNLETLIMSRFRVYLGQSYVSENHQIDAVQLPTNFSDGDCSECRALHTRVQHADKRTNKNDHHHLTSASCRTISTVTLTDDFEAWKKLRVYHSGSRRKYLVCKNGTSRCRRCRTNNKCSSDS